MLPTTSAFIDSATAILLEALLPVAHDNGSELVLQLIKGLYDKEMSSLQCLTAPENIM